MERNCVVTTLDTPVVGTSVSEKPVVTGPACPICGAERGNVCGQHVGVRERRAFARKRARTQRASQSRLAAAHAGALARATGRAPRR
jgi:hypothetical protein